MNTQIDLLKELKTRGISSRTFDTIHEYIVWFIQKCHSSGEKCTTKGLAIALPAFLVFVYGQMADHVLVENKISSYKSLKDVFKVTIDLGMFSMSESDSFSDFDITSNLFTDISIVKEKALNSIEVKMSTSKNTQSRK